MRDEKQPPLEPLRESLEALGQAHVFRFWERLDGAQRAQLHDQVARIAPRLPALLEDRQRSLDALRGDGGRELKPVDAIALPEHGGDPARVEPARQRGEEALAEGRVAAFVVAGGQGTRLGFPHPKGCFPVGPVSDRSLFEIQAQKLHGLGRRYGHRPAWYVMTSPATDAETRAHFAEERGFGLPSDDVFLFGQETVPAFDGDGKLVLEAPHRIFESPDGHGGSLTALLASGALDDMERRGVDTLFYYQVDNPLVRIADPVFIGFHEESEAEMSCKVVRKVDPGEKVGLVSRIDGRIGVVEYTELEDEERHARDAQGQLLFWAGNIAIHVFSLPFVRRVAARAREFLPFHASAKPIPTIDDRGVRSETAGHKLERFVFDALPAAERVCLLEVRRSEDFSPIKNAEGADSPESARRDLMAEYRRWLAAAHIETTPGDPIEIDHAVIDGPRDAADSGFTSTNEAGDAIRIAPGRRE